MSDPKEILAIIGKKADDESSDVSDSMHDDSNDSEMGLDQATDEILSAIGKRDSGALKEALKSFVTQCDSDDYSKPDDKSEKGE